MAALKWLCHHALSRFTHYILLSLIITDLYNIWSHGCYLLQLEARRINYREAWWKNREELFLKVCHPAFSFLCDCNNSVIRKEIAISRLSLGNYINRRHTAHRGWQRGLEAIFFFFFSEMPIDIAAFAYAAAVAGGGVLGYVKSSEFESWGRFDSRRYSRSS